MRARRSTSKAGFTLVEAIICVLILGVVFSAATSFISAAWRSTRTSQDKVFATQKAISVLSEVRSFIETPVTEEDSEGNLYTREKTIPDLDALDDGTSTDPILCVYDMTEKAEQIDYNNDGQPDPDHVRSANLRMSKGKIHPLGGAPGNYRWDPATETFVPWWKYERRITVKPLYEEGVIVRRDVRVVTVTIFECLQNGTKIPLAEVGTLLRTTAEAYPTTQAYDVYCIAVDSIPGWWVYMSYVKPFVETCLKDLENRNPGLEIREHWITKAGYGRDPEYCPYFNRRDDEGNGHYSINPVDYVYWYPGSLYNCDVDKYYSPDRFSSHINVEDEVNNGYDAIWNPYPYSIADQWNQCKRFVEATELREKRMRQRLDDKLPLLDETEPPYQLLLDDMIVHPEKYLNAIMINLHGELMPAPPVRNYADPAKDPVNFPGLRVVTHPERIWYGSVDPGLDAAESMSWQNPNSPEAYINFRVYAYVHPGQSQSDPLALRYPRADAALSAAARNPNRQGYYTSDPDTAGTTEHPNTTDPKPGLEYMPGDQPNSTSLTGGQTVVNDNVPITLVFEYRNAAGEFVPINLIDQSIFPDPCPPVRVWKIEGGFDLMTEDVNGYPALKEDGTPIYGQDGIQDDYRLIECVVHPTADAQQRPDEKDGLEYKGQMYARFAPPSDEEGHAVDPLDIEYASGPLKEFRNQFGERYLPAQDATLASSVLELFNTPMYTPEVCRENEGRNTYRGLMNRRDTNGTRYHLYEMEYIPCSTDDRPNVTVPITDMDSNHPYYLHLHRPQCLRSGYARDLAWSGADIVAGDYGHTKTIYKNEGVGYWTKGPYVNSGDGQNTRDIHLAHFNDDNGDGAYDDRDLIDIVVGNNGQNYLYLNNDSDGESWTKVDFGSGGNTYGIAVGDIDGDGDNDVLDARYNARPVWHENSNGSGTSWTEHDVSDQNYAARVAKLADVDGDGDLDAVIGITGQDIVFVNGGNGQMWFPIIINDTHAGDTYGIAVADMDVDGCMDIVVGQHATSDKVYLGMWNDLNANGNYDAYQAGMTEPWTDVNMNGRWDGGVDSYDGGGEMRLGEPWQVFAGDDLATFKFYGREPWTDLNANGLYDAGEPYVDLDGSGTYTWAEPWTDLDGDEAYTPGEPWADINGNKVPDIVRPWQDYNANGFLDTTEWMGSYRYDSNLDFGPDTFTRRIAVADFNNDGLPDVAAIRYSTAGDDAQRISQVYLASYEDMNGNSKYDAGEPWTDFVPPNGVWDAGEPYTDLDVSGGWTPGDPWVDLPAAGNGAYDAGEPFTDLPVPPDGTENATYDPTEWQGLTTAVTLDEPDDPGICVALADFNRDRLPDLAVGYNALPNRVYITTPSEVAGNPPTFQQAVVGNEAYNTWGIAVRTPVGHMEHRPKNTARWIIQVPKALVASLAGTDEVGALRVTTRIGRDLTTGVCWPVDPTATLSGRNDPQNVSRTCTWFANHPTKVPFSERYQFIGDPRHCPYVDLRANGDPAPADYTPFADGYNWYFCNFSDGHDASGYWGTGFDSSKLLDGWYDQKCEFDVPRYFWWLRQAVIESRVLFTTLTGFSFYYMCMGNEVGYDSANGASFTNGVPLTRKIFYGDTGTTYDRQMDSTSSHQGAKMIGADFVEGGMRWYAKPWVGEIFPDYMYDSDWRWPEHGETPAVTPRGNLPTGQGYGTFRWKNRGDMVKEGSIYADDSRPYGTTLVSAYRRTCTRGCTSMFNNLESDGRGFCHRSKSYGSLGTLQTVGQQLAERYCFPVPTQTSISRPFKLNEISWGWPSERNHYPYNQRNRVEIPYRMGNDQIFYTHDSEPATLIGSAIVRMMNPAIDIDGDGVTNDKQDCGYIVVNGIDKTTETGTAFIAKYSILTLIHSFLACGHPDLEEPGTDGVKYRIKQLPRVKILEPTLSTELQDPNTVDVRWSSEWFRWDGEPYTEEYPTDFAEDETMLKYVLMYSKDGGDTWHYMDDDASVMYPDGPGLGRHDLTNPRDSAHQLNDAGTGEEIWTWDVADENDFPESSYLIRVECYREGCSMHYAYHMEKIFIRR